LNTKSQRTRISPTPTGPSIRTAMPSIGGPLPCSVMQSSPVKTRRCSRNPRAETWQRLAGDPGRVCDTANTVSAIA